MARSVATPADIAKNDPPMYHHVQYFPPGNPCKPEGGAVVCARWADGQEVSFIEAEHGALRYKKLNTNLHFDKRAELVPDYRYDQN